MSLLHAKSAMYFDRPAVSRALSRAKRKGLSKFGAFVRRRARSSIRKRKKPSSPGKPPSSHTGILKKFILFAYDPATSSVVIGPAKTNQVFFDGDGRPATGTVPQVLEKGGQIHVLEVEKPDGGWRRADLRSKRRLAGKKTRLRKVDVQARPFMGPALTAELAKVDGLWRNSVR